MRVVIVVGGVDGICGGSGCGGGRAYALEICFLVAVMVVVVVTMVLLLLLDG